jgi:ATP-dependent DNA helicase RecG
MSTKKHIEIERVLSLGEGQKVEFKERIANLDREIVAFANAQGGSIYLGITDNGEIIGIEDTNRIRSRIQDIARNCDPPINISFQAHRENVIEIKVGKGDNKPYRSKSGFYMRVGANSQKLSRDEIIQLALSEGGTRFDGVQNAQFQYPIDFDPNKLKRFLELSGAKQPNEVEDVLISLDAAFHDPEKSLRFNQAGVLFFAREPQKFVKESLITCVRYADKDRFQILDRKEIHGDIISQIEGAISFLDHNNPRRYIITGDPKRREVRDYPAVAIREAVINALMHRDYYYNASHVYVQLFSDRLEIENPGGLFHGLTMEDLGKRSVRRNPIIADLLFRAGFVEKLGSGIRRMQKALADNNNPPMELSATNFFVLRFFPRINGQNLDQLTTRQSRVLGFIRERKSVTKDEVAQFLNRSSDTALREIKVLSKLGLVEIQGTGKATRYLIKN